MTLGRAEITLYPPVTAGKDANEQCLSVLCARKGWEALLTGDMETFGDLTPSGRDLFI